jgi:aspartyl-tRNA(Asn)/glutamyl-tRNA(Gln) amidotransferase subunit C
MVEINEALTLKVGHLARLALSEDEVKSFTTKIEVILKYVEQLQAVNVDGIEPMTHPLSLENRPDLKAPLRKDEARPFPQDENGKPKVLKHAPDVLFDGFKVPPIL